MRPGEQQGRESCPPIARVEDRHGSAHPHPGGFPIADPVVFAAGEGVDHSGFWTRPATREAPGAWLTG